MSMTLNEGPISARALVDGLAQGRFTSRALTEAFLARIAADTHVHAVCTPEPERALRSADASDARRAAGQPLGPLDGLPMTLKDACRVGGSRTTYGLRTYARYVPSASAKALAALEARGVVVLGRSMVPAGSFDWNGRNPLVPECTNPHDPQRSPGGSSAGAAAGVAAGLSPLDVGSDIAGSIRLPAHFCGVSGLRTTDGWIPIDDMAPEGLPVGYAHLTTLGPIAREVADLSLVLDAWAEAFPADERPLAEGPIAASFGFSGVTADARTRAAMERWLSERDSVEATPDLDFAALFRDWGTIAGFEFARGLPWFGRNTPVRWAYGRFAVQPRLGEGPLTTHFRAGLLASARDYESALGRRAQAQSILDTFLTRHRAWALPVCPGSATLRSLGGQPIDGLPYTAWHGTLNCPTAVLGTPALALPLPVAGLPTGLQLHARRYADRALVRAFAD
jgi:amidase